MIPETHYEVIYNVTNDNVTGSLTTRYIKNIIHTEQKKYMSQHNRILLGHNGMLFSKSLLPSV